MEGPEDWETMSARELFRIWRERGFQAMGRLEGGQQDEGPGFKICRKCQDT